MAVVVVEEVIGKVVVVVVVVLIVKVVIMIVVVVVKVKVKVVIYSTDIPEGSLDCTTFTPQVLKLTLS